MNEKRKSLIKNIFLYGGLVIVIIFTLITAIVVNYKNNQLRDLKEKNDQVESVIDEETSLKLKENEIFSKNLLKIIDNQKNI